MMASAEAPPLGLSDGTGLDPRSVEFSFKFLGLFAMDGFDNGVVKALAALPPAAGDDLCCGGGGGVEMSFARVVLVEPVLSSIFDKR